jgi:hypothetical protein
MLDQRQCSECPSPIPPERAGIALTCSPECARVRHNRQHREQYAQDPAYRAKKNAPRGRCGECGTPVHRSSRSRPVVFCQPCQVEMRRRITW